jgi:hypothetical protein
MGTIGDLAALVTAVGISIYVMGLVGLSVTIRRTFAADFTTAWYAVSLLPRTVVAGQGVRLWLRWPIIAIAIVLPTTQIAGDNRVLLALAVIAMFSAAMFFTLRRLLFNPQQRRNFLVLCALALGYTTSAVPGLILLAVGIVLITQDPSGQPSIAKAALDALGIAAAGTHFAIGVILILLGGLGLGVRSALDLTTPLPPVKLEITEEYAAAMKEICNPCRGWLVAHSDGFWHLLEERGALQSIPDDKVLAVRTGGEEHIPPAKKEASSSEEAPPEEDAKPDVGKAE